MKINNVISIFTSPFQSYFFPMLLPSKETSCELKAAEGIIKNMEELEPEQVAAFSSRADFLNKELKKIEKNISSKLEILETYVAFLQSAVEVWIIYLFSD